MTGAPSQRRPVWTRKKDLSYIVFLSLVVFLALTIDFVPLYPVKLPPWATALHDYYRANYNDPLYANDPPFFRLYVVVEAVYSVPTCVWAIRGLIRDDEMVPVHLLAFATHLVTSTLVCFVEVLATDGWPREDINKNLPGYVVFFAVASVLWVDMFSRLRTALTGKSKVS